MKIPMRFYYNLGASIALLPFPLQFLPFWLKFRIVAESPSLNINYICLKITDSKKKKDSVLFLKRLGL